MKPEVAPRLENLHAVGAGAPAPARGDPLGPAARGTELGEVALARSLGISRGPLREALGQLAAEGLVLVAAPRGVVTRLTREEFIDAYQVREALESLALQLAVPRLTDAEKAELHRMCDAMAREAAARRHARLLRDQRAPSTRCLVTASGNGKLERGARAS